MKFESRQSDEINLITLNIFYEFFINLFSQENIKFIVFLVDLEIFIFFNIKKLKILKIFKPELSKLCAALSKYFQIAISSKKTK